MEEILHIIKYKECKWIMFKYRHRLRIRNEDKEIEIHANKNKIEVENFLGACLENIQVLRKLFLPSSQHDICFPFSLN